MTPSDSWHPLDIDAPEAELPNPPGWGVHVVAFLSDPESCRTGWSARAALRIAREWADSGLRTVLADVNLESPQLHLTAGVDNREGISDALLFGSSFQRVAVPLDEGLMLASAGTAIPDAESLRVHPRWRDFAAGFHEARALLILYLPHGEPGVDALLGLCDAAVVMAADGEAVPELPRGTALLATVGPPDSSGVPASGHEVDEPAAESSPVTPAPTGAADGGESHVPPAPDPGVPDDPAASVAPEAPTLDEILADEEERDASGEPTSADAEGIPAPVQPEHDNPFAPRRSTPRSEKSGRGRGLLIAILAAALLALVAGWMGWIDIPGITPDEAAESLEETALSTLPEALAAEPQSGAPVDDSSVQPSTPEPDSVVAATESPGGDEPSPDPAPVAAFTIALASYSDLDDALGRVRRLARANPDFHFLVSPVEVRGSPYFRVLAGSAADPDEVMELRGRLGEAVSGGDQWIVRQAGMGYLLGTLPDLDTAEITVQDLRERGIPAHILRVDGASSVPEYRVYSGAYASAAEAGFMGRFLRERGINDAVLTERRGVSPR